MFWFMLKRNKGLVGAVLSFYKQVWWCENCLGQYNLYEIRYGCGQSFNFSLSSTSCLLCYLNDGSSEEIGILMIHSTYKALLT